MATIIIEKDLWIVLLRHHTGYVETHALTKEELVKPFVKLPNYIKTIKTTYNVKK